MPSKSMILRFSQSKACFQADFPSKCRPDEYPYARVSVIFQFVFLHHSVLGKLATSSIRANTAWLIQEQKVKTNNQTIFPIPSKTKSSMHRHKETVRRCILSIHIKSQFKDVRKRLVLCRKSTTTTPPLSTVSR